MEYSPKKIKKLLDIHNFNFKKNYGQNFIIDENIINNIINKASIDNDTLVVEIGPGAGSLTSKLAVVAKNVLCYEIDKTLSNILSDVLSDFSNVDIIYQDFLESKIKEDISKYEYKKLYVVANLPYYITTPIIVKLIEDNIDVDKIIVMVQKEVGNRFKAEPGSKDYSSLSVFLNYYFEVKKIIDVSRNVFIPRPNVDSIVVQFSKREKLETLKNSELFFKLVRDSFKQKRKTLKNNLNGYNLEKIDEVLRRHKMDLTIRAEHIPIEVFIDIANNI
jgi:16S rRNA (adenine1518-N6/adenine1519-N6)-dimethyltransferase